MMIKMILIFLLCIVLLAMVAAQVMKWLNGGQQQAARFCPQCGTGLRKGRCPSCKTRV